MPDGSSGFLVTGAGSPTSSAISLRERVGSGFSPSTLIGALTGAKRSANVDPPAVGLGIVVSGVGVVAAEDCPIGAREGANRPPAPGRPAAPDREQR